MVVKLGGIQKILSTLYQDELTVERYESGGIASDRTTMVNKVLTEVHSKVPCRISFDRIDTPDQGQVDLNPYRLQVKVFCDVRYAIEKGDKLTVIRKDDDGNNLAEYTGLANMPFKYTSHQEIELVNEGVA